MIKVKKNFEDVPSILRSNNREDSFLENVKRENFEVGTKFYKVKSVQDRLKKIYSLKCAYCEKKLLDAPKHIEHYRPKDSYFWLAYSWDNLLLSCGECNSIKGVDFKVENSQISYGNEKFDDIHSLGLKYDKKEKPYIINPEKDDVLNYIKYRADGTIYSDDKRVEHTIEIACKLNRKELVEKREEIINDFVYKIEEHYTLFQINGDISRFFPDVKLFIEKVVRESEFYSLRYYMIYNIEEFFENENIQKILEIALNRVKI